MRKLAVLAATVVGICLSVPAAQAFSPTAPHLQFSGVALGREKNFTLDQALKTRREIDGAGFQAEREVFIWNGTATPADIDLQAACNAAQTSSGLKVLMFNFRPQPNNWPTNQASLDAYNQTMAAVDAKVLTGTGTNGLPCWPAASPPQIMWMVGNEPNSHNFCNGDGTTNDLLKMHQACAKLDAMLLHSSYAFIHGAPSILGEEQKYHVQMAVVGGGLSSHDAPLDYLARYLQAHKALGYKSCDMDYFGFHPYALNASDTYSGFGMVETKVEPMLKAAGCPLKIIYTEMGVETVIPAGLSYNSTAPLGVRYEPESNMVVVYKKFLAIMQSQPDVVGFMNFELEDEQDLRDWQSGFYYYSGFQKGFVHDLQPILAAVGNAPMHQNGPTPDLVSRFLQDHPGRA